MIKVKNLTKYFGNKKVLDNISFEVKKGEICGFIGENGAGKSTTMKILSTLILDYQGKVFINGKDISKNTLEIRKIIGFMPDQYGLYEDMTLGNYLDFFRNLYSLKSDRKKIEEILEKVSLKNKIDDNIGNLSRGMTQRICLARALITEPQVLILDEPASGLDPKLRIELKNLLLDLKKKGITIFVSSHILNELGEYCDSIIFIESGKIKKSGNLEELAKKPKTQDKLIKIKNSQFKKVQELLKENNIDFEEVKNKENLEEIYLELIEGK